MKTSLALIFLLALVILQDSQGSPTSSSGSGSDDSNSEPNDGNIASEDVGKVNEDNLALAYSGVGLDVNGDQG